MVHLCISAAHQPTDLDLSVNFCNWQQVIIEVLAWLSVSHEVQMTLFNHLTQQVYCDIAYILVYIVVL